MSGQADCTKKYGEGMVYIPERYYKEKHFPEVCFDQSELTNKGKDALVAKATDTFMNVTFPESPEGFNGPEQPLVMVPGRQITLKDGSILLGAKEICEMQGKRLLRPDEWASIASKNGTQKHSTRSGKLDEGVHYNASASRNVGETKGHYLEYGGVEVYDMNGNVDEWTQDSSSGDFFINGGSWESEYTFDLKATTRRGGFHPRNHGASVGVRCAGSPKGA